MIIGRIYFKCFVDFELIQKFYYVIVEVLDGEFLLIVVVNVIVFDVNDNIFICILIEYNVIIDED